MPERIQWTDAQGSHEERLPLEPTVGEVLNDQFYRLARGETSLAPTLDDALAAARAVRAIRRSQQEGLRIPC
jgi:predicted dehydrogenase